MKSKIVLIGIAIAIISACSPKVVTLTQADADRGAAKFKGVTVESLNEGKAIFQQNCNECHGYKKPASRTEEKWNKIIPGMVAKLNQKMGKEVIDAQKQELLLQYVVTMSSASKK